jgi:hypothetical protein
MTNQISFEEDRATHEPVAILQGRFLMGDLVNILSQLEKRTGKMPTALRTGNIDVMPVVSAETGMPMVELQSPAFDKPLQMDHAQAFEFGHLLIEITAIAIGDAMVFGFISGELQIPKEQAVGMLHAFRGYRDRMLSSRDQDDESPSKAE